MMTQGLAPARLLEARGPVAMVLAALVGVVLLLLATRNSMNHVPTYDELLHVLSARGVVSTGEPVIADGLYGRAEMFTRLVAASYRAFGDSLPSARFPSLVSALLLVIVVAAWVTRHAGFLAGAATAVVFTISANTIGLAVFTRFYTFHALLAVVACIAGYEASVPERRMGARLACVVVAIALLVVAFVVQITTVIVAGALFAGALAAIATDKGGVVNQLIRSRPYVVSAVVGGGLLAIVILEWQLGLIAHATEAPRWAQGNVGRWLYYVQNFNLDLPLFWPIFPLAAGAALFRYPRFAIFCTVVFLSALTVHSIAAAKAMRYLYYALPFVCAVCGIGVAVAVQMTSEVLARRISATVATAVALALWFVFPVALSQEGQRAARFITGKEDASQLSMYAGEADWSLGASLLEPAARDAEVVVVSSGVKGLYYLGRYDYELNGTAVTESETGQEFGRDPRTGRRTLSRVSALSEVLAKSRSTLIVVDNDKSGKDSGVTSEVVAFIGGQCRALPLPATTGAAAWSCPHGG